MATTGRFTDLETKLEKFDINRQRNEEKAAREIQEMQRRYQEVKNEARNSQMEALRKNKEYIQELDKKGWEDWKKNQDVRLTRQQKEAEFENKMTQRIKNKILEQEEYERTDANEGVDDFETNAQKLGVDLEHDPEEIKTMEKAGISSNALMIKLKGEG